MTATDQAVARLYTVSDGVEVPGSPFEIVRSIALAAWELGGDYCVPAPMKYRQANGYSRVSRGKYESFSGHRLAYEAVFGPIPPGLQIDHTCHQRDASCSRDADCTHRMCVNPAYLEAVTPAENTRRARALITHCPHGHEYTPENSRIRRNQRSCRRCVRDYSRRVRQARRDAMQQQGGAS